MTRGLRSIARSRGFRLSVGLIGIAAIAFADRSLRDEIPLALLYLAPIAAMSTVLRRWQIPLLGAVCAVVAEASDAYPWTVAEGIPRDALYFMAYTGAGLYVAEALSRRRAERLHVGEMEAEMEARREMEEQLRLVIANSSIAIVTSDEAGTILNSNEAAEHLFLGEAAEASRPLSGQALQGFMPSLARVQIRKEGWEHLRTMMECQGFRADRQPFLAEVWFSTYASSRGSRLTAMIVDSSLDVRDREQASLEQVMRGSKLAVGALTHEIRNICAAISVVQQNLQTNVAASEQVQEFDALRQLVAALERVASVELAMVKRQGSRLDLDVFLRDLYVVASATLADAEIALDWEIEPGLPAVWADHQGLLQVFLNLLRNAEQALAGARGVHGPRLGVAAEVRGDCVQIRLSDNGPGVGRPEELFRPFAADHGATGLGLYLSRAMMRSFNGDLRYQAREPGAAGGGTSGATFAVELAVAGGDE